jgi:uncharacterized RDD family membrane protein YckC
MMTDDSLPLPAGLWRRLGAILYDGLLLFGVIFVATALLLPFTGGHAIAAGTWWYEAYLLILVFLFYGWCWTHGGQTLGMLALKIKVQQPDGSAISWRQALQRFLCALVSTAALGLGFLWILLDREKRAWHDRWSGTVLVRATKSIANEAIQP